MAQVSTVHRRSGNRSALSLVGPAASQPMSIHQEQIRRRIGQWQQLFSPGPQRYSLDGYEDLYVRDPADELLVYDNYAPTDSRFRGFDRYRNTWEKSINEDFPGFVMYRIEIDAIEVFGDGAWSALTWWGSIAPDGKIQFASQHATHVWRLHDGHWRIAHEHLTAGVKENGRESHREPESLWT